MKISKAVIVRTILVVIVIINQGLKSTGHQVINIEENTVASFVEMIINVGVILTAWWYNNSFTEKARKAQAFMKELQKSEKESAGEDNVTN